MANNDFFSEETMDDQNQEQTFEVNGENYTQDELSRLVGLGKIGAEAEERYNTKLDRVWPEFTKSRQELETLRADQRQREQQALNQKQSQGQELTPDEVKRQAQATLRELGYLSEQEVREVTAQVTRETLQGYQLLNDTQSLVSQRSADGDPKTTTENLLQYMADRGINNPEDAYELMFKKELRELEAKKLQSLRQPGIVTERSSSAGGKQPEQVRPTKDNLDDLVLSALRGGQGQ